MQKLYWIEHKDYIYDFKAKDEDIFQYARKIVASELQAITFREYLPSIFGGSEEIPPYRGYNDSLDASADHVAVTAALR